MAKRKCKVRWLMHLDVYRSPNTPYNVAPAPSPAPFLPYLVERPPHEVIERHIIRQFGEAWTMVPLDDLFDSPVAALPSPKTALKP